MSKRSLSRREVLRGGRDLGGLLALSTLFQSGPGAASLEAAQAALRSAPDIYQSIGIRPLINGRGTFTIISGSLMLPEVRAAMDAAAQQYVHLDELADAIGARLATLTGAEWGLVTSGCSGSDARHRRLRRRRQSRSPRPHPEPGGLSQGRSHHPAAFAQRVRRRRSRRRRTSHRGGHVAELEAALGPRTAMIYVMASPRADQSPLNLKADRAAG